MGIVLSCQVCGNMLCSNRNLIQYRKLSVSRVPQFRTAWTSSVLALHLHILPHLQLWEHRLSLRPPFIKKEKSTKRTGEAMTFPYFKSPPQVENAIWDRSLSSSESDFRFVFGNLLKNKHSQEQYDAFIPSTGNVSHLCWETKPKYN